MAKSSMVMTKDEIAELESEIEPQDDAGDQPGKAEEGGAEVEYVGPDESGDTGAVAGKETAAKPAEGKKGADKGDKAEKGKDKQVPYDALYAERSEHKKTREALEAERLRQARLEEKLGFLAGQIEEAKKPAREARTEEIPDKLEDPVGYMEYLATKIGKMEEGLSQARHQTEEQTKQQEAIRWYAEATTADEQNFVQQEAPDYYEAAQFLRESRMREISMIPGYRNNPAAVMQFVNDEALQLSARAIQNRQSPAAMFYEIAKARGWQPKAESDQTEATAEAAQPAAKAKNGAEEIARLTRAKDAAESLSTGGGSSPAVTKMDLNALDRMSNAEITEWLKRETKRGGTDAVDAALAKMMGVR